MVSEARALLDEQTEKLDELRDVAQLVYLELALLPALIRTADTDRIASYMARLMGNDEKLNDCLKATRHLLCEADPVVVPALIVEGAMECPSACEGAAELLAYLRMMRGRGVASLSSRLTDAPTGDFERLAEVVRQETNDAIDRATDRFYSTKVDQEVDQKKKSQKRIRPWTTAAHNCVRVFKAKICKDDKVSMKQVATDYCNDHKDVKFSTLYATLSQESARWKS